MQSIYQKEIRGTLKSSEYRVDRHTLPLSAFIAVDQRILMRENYFYLFIYRWSLNSFLLVQHERTGALLDARRMSVRVSYNMHLPIASMVWMFIQLFKL